MTPHLHRDLHPRPQPLCDLTLARLAAVCGVFTDVDDTLTVDGALEPAARQAHSVTSGHTLQTGARAVQTVAPRSINARL